MATFVAADIILGATTIRGVTNTSHKSGNEHLKSATSGGAVLSQISGNKAEEVTSFTSTDCGIAAALGTNTFAALGLYVSASTITVPLKSRAAGGLFVSGSNFCAISGATALIVPTSWEVSQDVSATFSADIHWVSGGATPGLTAGATGSAGNALASQAFSQEFGLGPCYINGTLIVGVQSFKVTPGIQVVKFWSSGLPRPTIVSIQKVEPMIEIVTADIDAAIATTNAFTAMTSANCYLRLRADAGVYDATVSVNTRFTFAGGISDTGSIEVSDNNNGTATITLHGKALTSSSAVTIP